ncbi:enoyl-CoA hydratase-related protein [Arenibacterium sp. CAU 1754]
MSENIAVSSRDGVTTLTITREDKKNALTQAMYGAMADAITAYGAEDATRAFVITGAGDMFTAGNDLQDFAMGAKIQGIPPVIRFLHAIRDCEKPLIAAVNGPAIGVGLTMLLHCDLVYAAQAATFSAPFVRLGLVPEAGSSILLPQTVGMAVANDILLGGRTLSAVEALQHGLVARMLPDDGFQDAIAAIAAGVAAASPTALRRSKALIRTQRDVIAAQMEAEALAFAQQLGSPDFAESVAALREKRVPVYR